MDLSSGYTIADDAYDNNGNQGSHLTLSTPAADQKYTCTVTPVDQDASNTEVDLDVYGTYLYS